MERKKNWIKCNDSLFVDLNIIKSVVVRDAIFTDVQEKTIAEGFEVLGFTKEGVQIPLPLFRHEQYGECEAWVNAHFLDNKE